MFRTNVATAGHAAGTEFIDGTDNSTASAGYMIKPYPNSCRFIFGANANISFKSDTGTSVATTLANVSFKIIIEEAQEYAI
jgi:hypothetical protein